LNSLAQIDFSQLESVAVQEWLDKKIRDKNLAETIKTYLRLYTYGNDPDIQSVGSALRQLYVAGPMYIDGGWQTLVNGLLAAAENGKAKIVKGKKVTRVERTDSSRWLVTLSDKTQVSAKIVVIEQVQKMPTVFSMIMRDPRWCQRRQKKRDIYAWRVWMSLLTTSQTKMPYLLLEWTYPYIFRFILHMQSLLLRAVHLSM
jgi:phytoene dehydrogenase-like protein